MSPNKEKFVNRLRLLRQERGFAAARHFAMALGIPENRYSRYERGDSEPDIDTIYRIFERLPASPNELFGLEGSGQTPTGFSSGPQAQIEGYPTADANRAESGDVSSPLLDSEAAAWRLAAAITRISAGRAPAERATLAELRATAHTFGALRSEPYETVARLVASPEFAALQPAAAREVEIAVAEFLSSLQ